MNIQVIMPFVFSFLILEEHITIAALLIWYTNLFVGPNGNIYSSTACDTPNNLPTNPEYCTLFVVDLFCIQWISDAALKAVHFDYGVLIEYDLITVLRKPTEMVSNSSLTMSLLHQGFLGQGYSTEWPFTSVLDTGWLMVFCHYYWSYYQ